MLRYVVGVGVGVMRISGRRFVALLARRAFKKTKGAWYEFHLESATVARVWVWVVLLWGLDLYCCIACCRWHQCGIKVGLCAGRVGAMPLLVLGHGGQGVKRGLLGLQKLQLKTVIVTLLCELESRGACACVRARAWYSVVCGQWVAWCACWPFNRMEWDQQRVRVRFFCADVVVKVWVLFRFSFGGQSCLIWGSRCLGGL